MASVTKKSPVYRVLFQQRDKLYEIYVRNIYQSDFYGFLEIENFVFGRNETVVDPVEERLQSEFKGVGRTYIPVYSVMRIDEVEEGGTARIRPLPDDAQSKVTPLFPSAPTMPGSAGGVGSDNPE